MGVQPAGSNPCSGLATSTPALLQLGDSLEEYLQTATSDPNLRRLMTAMSEAIRTIAYKVSGC